MTTFIKKFIIENKKNLTGSFWITFGNLIKVFLGITIVPFYARYVTPSVLGNFDFAMSITPFINQAISLGLTNSLARFYLQTKNKAYLGFIQKKIIRNSLIIIVTLFIIFIMFYNYFITYIPFFAFVLLLISSFIENISFIPNVFFKISEQYKKASIVDLISTIIRYGGTILLLIIIPNKIIALFLGSIFGTLYILIQSHISNYHFVYSENEINNIEKKALFQYSNPLILLGIAGIIYSSFDRIFLGLITRSNTEVGYYGMGQRLSSIISMGIIGIITVWGIKAFITDEESKFRKMQENLINLLIVILFSSIVFLLIFEKIIINRIFTSTYAISFSVSLWFILYFIWNKIRETLEYYFNRKGNSKLVTIVFISMTVLNVILYYVFIPKYKAVGAAIAMFISSIIHSSILYYLSYIEGHKLKNRTILLLISVTILVVFLIIFYSI